MKIPLIYNIRSVRERWSTTLATVIGIALVVVTFIGMLALSIGFKSAMIKTGRPDNVLIVRGGADSELTSSMDREQAAIIRALPQIDHLPDGRPLATGDVYVVVTMKRAVGAAGQTNVPVRGVDMQGAQVRDQVRITEGRMFAPGRPEVIVGRAMAARIEGMAVGDRIKLGQGMFTVVGHFAADGSAFESEVWGENEQLMGVFRGPYFQSMTFRLKDPAQFAAVKKQIEADPRMHFDAKRESDFFAGQSELLSNVLRFLAIFVTSIMAIGAVFGAINTMDAMVASRTREIALLLTLGFRPRSVMASFLLESLILALIGGIIGCLLALPLNGVTTSTTNMQSFAEVAFSATVTPALLAQGLAFAAAMGLVGGFLPARRAAKQVIANALRKT